MGVIFILNELKIKEESGSHTSSAGLQKLNFLATNGERELKYVFIVRTGRNWQPLFH